MNFQELIDRAAGIEAVGPEVSVMLTRQWHLSSGQKIPRARLAVELASQVALKVLDVLTPGHPALAAVDVFGHALSSIFNSMPASPPAGPPSGTAG